MLFIVASALLSVSFCLPLAAVADDSCETVSMIEDGSYPNPASLGHETLGDIYISCAMSVNQKTLRSYNTRMSAAREYLSVADQYERTPLLSFINYVKAYDLFTYAMLQAEHYGIGDENFAKEQSRKAALGIQRTAPNAIPKLSSTP